MKVTFRIFRTFIVSMLTIWLITRFTGLEFIYDVLGVTEEGTKDKIVAGISTLIVGIAFELIPYLFKKFIADKIRVTVTYIQDSIPVTKLRFRKEVNSLGVEEYKEEIVKIVFSLNEGTDVGYWMLKKLDAKVTLKYNPDHFSTVKKDGSIIENNLRDPLLSRGADGHIYIDVFNGFSSVGDYSMDPEIFIKPNYAYMDKADLTIKIQAKNWFKSLLARLCVEVVNTKLILRRRKEE